jgi:hypothetical protein
MIYGDAEQPTENKKRVKERTERGERRRKERRKS